MGIARPPAFASSSSRYPIRLFTPRLRLPQFHLQLAWHSRLDHDPAHSWFRQQLIELCSDL
jgi:DNA-binding transcriptional LysR family regulator